jgi:hypothetical protein
MANESMSRLALGLLPGSGPSGAGRRPRARGKGCGCRRNLDRRVRVRAPPRVGRQTGEPAPPGEFGIAASCADASRVTPLPLPRQQLSLVAAHWRGRNLQKYLTERIDEILRRAYRLTQLRHKARICQPIVKGWARSGRSFVMSAALLMPRQYFMERGMTSHGDP